MTKIRSGAEPFFYPGNDIGCLLVHGFTASAQEVHDLGRSLAGKGLTVRGVLLAGHGTSPRDLARTGWRDWYTSVRVGFEDLASRCKQVHVMGLSLGGALSLHLAAHEGARVAGVVAMATPLYLSNRLLPLASILRFAVRCVGKSRRPDWFDPAAAASRVAYDCYPIAAVASFLAFQRHLWDDLPEIRAPVLLIHSRQDKTALPENMLLINDMIGSAEKQMVWVEGSNHILTADAAREHVWALCYRFVAEGLISS